MTKTLPIRKELAQLILEKLACYPSLRLAILFGSLAVGRGQLESDLDIAVLADAPLGVEMKSRLISELAQIVNRPVDLVDLKLTGEPLLGEILTRGHRILGNDVEFARLLSRHLLDASDFLPYRERILKERRNAWIGGS